MNTDVGAEDYPVERLDRLGGSNLVKM